MDDMLTLAQAAEELGVAASTLRHQAKAGRLDARIMGKTWITTRREVERYRRENLGRRGRPRKLPLDAGSA
jgi:predicted site-specific integrase-resolvase